MSGAAVTTRRSRKPRAIAYAYLAPAFLVYALFLLIPLLHSSWISLFRWDGLTLGQWVGLDNYRQLVTDVGLRAAFGHVLVLVLFFAVLPVVLGLLLAAAVHRSRIRGIGFFRTVFFLPQVIAMVVVAMAWRAIYAPDGWLNSALRGIGLDGLTRSWLGEEGTALVSVGVVGTWVQTGLAFVLFLAGMGKISTELYETVRIDGGGAVREFITVTLPALRPEIGVGLTLTVIASLRTFDLVYVLTPLGGPGESTTVPAYEIYHRAFQNGQVGSAAAVGVAVTLLVFVISMAISRIAGSER